MQPHQWFSTGISPSPHHPGPPDPPLDPEDIKKAILRQIEYYFSDRNLAKDTHLRSQIDAAPDGSVPISHLATFARLAALSTDPAVIAKALANSNKVLVVGDPPAVRNRRPFRDPAGTGGRSGRGGARGGRGRGRPGGDRGFAGGVERGFQVCLCACAARCVPLGTVFGLVADSFSLPSLSLTLILVELKRELSSDDEPIDLQLIRLIEAYLKGKPSQYASSSTRIVSWEPDLQLTVHQFSLRKHKELSTSEWIDLNDLLLHGPIASLTTDSDVLHDACKKSCDLEISHDCKSVRLAVRDDSLSAKRPVEAQPDAETIDSPACKKIRRSFHKPHLEAPLADSPQVAPLSPPQGQLPPPLAAFFGAMSEGARLLPVLPPSLGSFGATHFSDTARKAFFNMFAAAAYTPAIAGRMDPSAPDQTAEASAAVALPVAACECAALSASSAEGWDALCFACQEYSTSFYAEQGWVATECELERDPFYTDFEEAEEVGDEGDAEALSLVLTEEAIEVFRFAENFRRE
ncbi:hypothetical protein BDK51DRAFT_46689, partial [Blyttiomyces helicus]